MTRPALSRTAEDRGPAGRPRASKAAPGGVGARKVGPDEKPPNDVQPPEPTIGAGDVHRIVADAVKLGYDVLGQNLLQGRATADRIGAHAYGPNDVQEDINQIAGRFSRLVRDLATVSFDLLGAVLRDPTLHEAIRPKPISPPHGYPGAPVTVGCVVKGNSNAKAAPLILKQPDTPARLTVTALHSPQRGLKPITDVTFMASDDEQHVMVLIEVPADQPAGVYSGVVCDAESHAPLGTLCVTVAA